jgi:hypothetical protein
MTHFWLASLDIAFTFINGVRQDEFDDEPWERRARWNIAFRTRYLAAAMFVLLSLYIAITAYVLQLEIYECSLLFSTDYISSCFTVVAPNHRRIVRPRVLDALFFLITAVAYFSYAVGGTDHLGCYRHRPSKALVRRTLGRIFLVFSLNVLGRMITVFDGARLGPANAFFSFWNSLADVWLINLMAKHFALSANRPASGRFWSRLASMAAAVDAALDHILDLAEEAIVNVCSMMCASRRSPPSPSVASEATVPKPGSSGVRRGIGMEYPVPDDAQDL